MKIVTLHIENKNEGKMDKLCCIGHITLDKIITPEKEVNMFGGTAYYFAHAMYHLNGGRDFHLVTALAPSEMRAIDDLRERGIHVTALPSTHTVYFENKYGANQNNRTQRVLAKADPFQIDDLKYLKAGVYHLGSLLADDFSLDLLRHLSDRGTLSVESQGFLREVREEKVYPTDWANKLKAFKYIDVLKVNEHEMEILSGQSEAHDAALQLAEWGINEVCVTLGDKGALILENDHFYDIPAFPPKKVVDATGCGDTFSTGYLYMRNRGADPEEAGRFAAAMSTLKLEKSGPFSGTEDDVWRMMR